MMNKVIIFLILLISISTNTFSQKFSGTATFQTSSNVMVTFSPVEKDSIGEKEKPKNQLTANKEKNLNDQIRKAMQKEYVLTFNKTASLYKELPKLKDMNEEKGIEVIGLGSGTEGGLYKNNRDKIYLENRDVFGKLFLVKDTLVKWDWEISKESKKIGAYLCYKATTTKISTRKRMKIVDGEEKEVERTDSTHIIAWFTPEIPISQGPAEYWGLPGFILEVNDNKLKIVCSEVTVETGKKGKKICPPKKGKKVDRKTFKEIYDKKS